MEIGVGAPLVLVISTPISLGLGLEFVRAPIDTGMPDTLQIGSMGAEGVGDGVEGVKVGVIVGVRVWVGVNVRDGVTLGVRVLVLVGVRVRVRVCVGASVRVDVGGPGDGVQDGSTKLVNVGKSVGDGLTVAV